MLRRIRIISQAVFFLAFLFLLVRTQYNGSDELALPVKLLLEIDPLAFITTLLASGTVQGMMWLALIMIVLTFVFGRFFCGWVCPLGTLIQLAGKLPIRRRRSVIETNHAHPAQVIKFYLLGALMVAAFFGLNWAGIFDPLSLVIRSLGLVVLPGLEVGLRACFEWVYFANPLGLSEYTEPIYDSLQGSVLNFNQPHFHQAVFMSLIFTGILVVSFVRYRFWCRILCPLGALYGVIARFGLFRINQNTACTSCRICTFTCHGGADPEVQGKWRPSECFVCGNCSAKCTESGLQPGFDRPRLRLPNYKPATAAKDADAPTTPIPAGAFAGTSITRRHLILSSLIGATAVPVMGLGESTKRPHPALIRPPGSRPEPEFLELCVRCGECMKVCLTNGLQPTLMEAGLEGLWSPRLVPRIGYCEFGCTLCGQVCPTQAIKELDVETKKKVKIGLAVFDTTRCLPYAFQKPCIVCEEHCPLPKKAIWFVEQEVVAHDGSRQVIKQPRVDLDLCIGCGICETKCVIQDLPAIRVTSANEDRNPANKVVLQNTAYGGAYGENDDSSDNPYGN
jgi:polyferredoxin/ferredoxin